MCIFVAVPFVGRGASGQKVLPVGSVGLDYSRVRIVASSSGANLAPPSVDVATLAPGGPQNKQLSRNDSSSLGAANTVEASRPPISRSVKDVEHDPEATERQRKPGLYPSPKH